MNEQTHLSLHGLAVKNHATAHAVAALLGLDAVIVAEHLTAAVQSGRCVEMGDRYLLTPAGRMIVEANYSRYFASARADQSFNAAHGRFEIINDELKQLITDWQTIKVGGTPLANDHSDGAYDEKIVARLARLHDKTLPILAAFAIVLPRFAHYMTKLQAALTRVEDGESAWLSEVAIASYHSVWFELHEDLLRVLGRTRTQ